MGKLLLSSGKHTLPVLPQINCLISSRRNFAVKRVLIVGGEPGLQEYLGWVLGAAGYDVHEARDSDCPADLVKSKSIDLIITDIGTLDRDRFEALVDVRRTFPEINVIAISEHYTYQWAFEALGADHILEKPFDSADLRAMVGSL